MKKTMLVVAGLLSLFATVPTRARAAPPRSSTQEESPQKAKIFSGTVIKNGDKFVLSDTASKLSYILDDAGKASQFEGKKVKVTGTVNAATNTIHVESIEEVA